MNELVQKGLTADVSPLEVEKQAGSGKLRSDAPYRLAAMKYEETAHPPRFPELKDATQEGHDIDSYTHPDGDPDRRLIRRIEVKGRGRLWDADETVEMSKPQFHNAMNQLTEGEDLHPDFDYWLYVVETDENGKLNVLPIRNVAEQTAKFSFRGGSWRNMVKPEPPKNLETDDQQ